MKPTPVHKRPLPEFGMHFEWSSRRVYLKSGDQVVAVFSCRNMQHANSIMKRERERLHGACIGCC